MGNNAKVIKLFFSILRDNYAKEMAVSKTLRPILNNKLNNCQFIIDNFDDKSILNSSEYTLLFLYNLYEIYIQSSKIDMAFLINNYAIDIFGKKRWDELISK